MSLNPCPDDPNWFGELLAVLHDEELIRLRVRLLKAGNSRLGDTVLDPFSGSGTTGKVALELGRKAILIELNPKYVELAQKRTFVTPGMI